MGTQITRLTRLAAAGLSAVLLFATTACAATSPAETEPDNKTSVPAPTGPINVVASLNQWGSLAAELGGDDVEVTSIVNSTNVDAHDFEPKTSDVAKLSKAQIIVANGAGYDSWATKSMTKTTNIVSAASVMGAVEGDNPHLWFSKDARSSMATAITDAYIKALPSKKKAFQKRLKAWQADEKSLETWASEFTKSHSNLTYAATEPVVYYLMADLGFKDQTPKGYTQSTASGGEPAPADLQSFQKLIEDKGVDVLVNNTQEASDATNMITGAAGRADVPVVDVSEQMPKDADTLNAWINQLINTIIDAVDAMEGNGPSGGTVRHTGCLIASRSPFCLDLLLNRLIALKPQQAPTVLHSIRRGLCPDDPSGLRVLNPDSLPLTIPDFVHPQSKTVDFSGNLPPFLRPAVQKAAKLLSPRPVIDPERCIGCGKCAQSCPAQIIRIQAHKAKIQHGCIRCYCCHEMCPVKAIHIRGRV